MGVIMRLERNKAFVGKPPFENGLLGYDWLEVLAIVPVALGKPGKDCGDWCGYTVTNDYVCRTADGLRRLRERDVWATIDKGEMKLASEQTIAKQAPQKKS